MRVDVTGRCVGWWPLIGWSCSGISQSAGVVVLWMSENKTVAGIFSEVAMTI